MDTTTVDAVVETGPSQEWYQSHRTTPEEQESATWAEGRNQDIEANKALKDTLGLEYGAYSKQLDALSSEERLGLKGKTAEEIAEVLDARAEAERELQKLEKEAREKAAENFEGAETPHLREIRNAMKTANKEIKSLDEQIAELQRLNELRDNPSAEGWDDLPSEYWRAAREGKMDSFGTDIANLIQEKQAKLQEVALHQNAYHEESRSLRPQSMPIGQIVGNDGQPLQVTRADIAALVQLERDEQMAQERVAEARKHYSDWDQTFKNLPADVDVTPGQLTFIKTLPNSADVAYYLATHHDETRAIAKMNSHEAMRALISVSHKTARASASEAPRKTNAPKPPSPVGGTSSKVFDVNDDSQSADDWLRGRNAQLRKQGKF